MSNWTSARSLHAVKLSEVFAMRCLFTAFLSTAAVCAGLAATPAAAQVAGNPGDQHTPTPYTRDYWSQPHSVFGASGTTPGAAANASPQAVQPRPNCTATQDFNGRYTVA